MTRPEACPSPSGRSCKPFSTRLASPETGSRSWVVSRCAASPARRSIVARLLADTCEACGSHDHVESHHVRKIDDLTKKGKRLPKWKEVMITRQRKTLVLCRKCHHDLHAGKPIQFTSSNMESRMPRKAGTSGSEGGR